MCTYSQLRFSCQWMLVGLNQIIKEFFGRNNFIPLESKSTRVKKLSVVYWSYLRCPQSHFLVKFLHFCQVNLHLTGVWQLPWLYGSYIDKPMQCANDIVLLPPQTGELRTAEPLGRIACYLKTIFYHRERRSPHDTRK